MKKILPLLTFFVIAVSCSHRYYKASNFEEKAKKHKLVAVLPAEMIFTGTLPKNLSPEAIAQLEEQESRDFQVSLYNSILRHANTRKYITTINFQDINITLQKLQDSSISIRDSWKMDDKKLAKALGVDAVIKMRIQKQRYMSDVASYGVSTARRIISGTNFGSKIPIPSNISKTNDVIASCNLISENQTLWNDSYKMAADWNSPANDIIEDITDNFGRHFPYKKKRR